PAPALIPADEVERALMFGLIHEIAGADGYGWNRRLIFFAKARAAIVAAPETPGIDRESLDRLAAKYDYGGDAARARQRIVAIFKMLVARLHAQKAGGSRYFIGDSLTAADIYWAAFCALVKPLPLDLCPVSPGMHETYTERDPAILAAADPILLAHRDYIYERYLELPMRL
ncbi:MAG: hypothetical protein D6782_08100, partial [Alphaproteobacteria bacterium]